MKNVIESIEEEQKHNNIRKMYQHNFSIIRNKKGELAMNTKEKAEMWKEYFDKLLNTQEPRELIRKGNKEISEVEELTIEDVKKAIRNLTDGIHLELIKYRGNKLLNRMYELVRHLGGGKNSRRIERNNNSSYTQKRTQR